MGFKIDYSQGENNFNELRQKRCKHNVMLLIDTGEVEGNKENDLSVIVTRQCTKCGYTETSEY